MKVKTELDRLKNNIKILRWLFRKWAESCGFVITGDYDKACYIRWAKLYVGDSIVIKKISTSTESRLHPIIFSSWSSKCCCSCKISSYPLQEKKKVTQNWKQSRWFRRRTKRFLPRVEISLVGDNGNINLATSSPLVHLFLPPTFSSYCFFFLK